MRSNMMGKPTLLIMAAGMGSRYGTLKQFDDFGPAGETILDYSIYDAIAAGFGKIVFVVRAESLPTIRSLYEEKLAHKIEIRYAVQDLDLRKFGIKHDVSRIKPWGTGHAVLSAFECIDEPFAVINADDFYGRDAFQKMADFLRTEISHMHMGMIGFRLANTLSDHGAVSRGVCTLSTAGTLEAIVERTQIYYNNSDGVNNIVYKEDEQEHVLDPEIPVSMNFWGFTPRIFKIALDLFTIFVEQNLENPKAEFFIPTVADYMIRNSLTDFAVIGTNAKWFGVTYREDKPIVQQSILELVKAGVYPRYLFSG